jgi:hypothetical protein
MRDIFEAFSCLSDDEDIMERDPEAAQERLAHAKKPLHVLMDEDPATPTHPVQFIPLTCSLSE